MAYLISYDNPRHFLLHFFKIWFSQIYTFHTLDILLIGRRFERSQNITLRKVNVLFFTNMF